MRPALRFAAQATLLGLAIHLGGPPTALAQATGRAATSAAPPAAARPPAILLWPHGAPGPPTPTRPAAGYRTTQGEWVVTHVAQPTLTPFLPVAAAATGVAVLLLPGGGHRELWRSHEGDQPAAWFAAHGIAAFVVEYRLAGEAHSPYSVDQDELGDVQRALRLVKSRAAEWHLDTAKVGVLGFSAGGELAGLAAMRFTASNPSAPDPIDRLSDRPAFQVLLYPGNSGRLEVRPHAPPAFIAGGYLDRPDIAQGMAQLYLKYQQQQVPAELHIYAGVGHGFGLRPTTEGAVAEWPRQVRLWLQEIGCVKK